ncbi:caspase family protein [Corallococcus sp. M34]|uniref:caspase family protein n=1 Tax=Citreicoccus inhibens TaxID=2849499 RepID=UPI001C217CE9|nr:caspase family protein [Citreicoccus inhibens]MBU8899618.1 caspase family protein [Citreicoccus inhibens]
MLLVGVSSSARAETFRIAVVVGHNTGAGSQPPLRYAEADAVKVAGVLKELGGVKPEDLRLLRSPGLQALHDALEQTTAKVRQWHQDPSARVILTFYYSGHSDGDALELGRERLRYADLRRWLEGTGANVRIALVDSCRSGALLALKGGTPGPTFDIRLTDELDSSGQALLTSSAADELALESRELGGAFFTHHLVSGLRGAADLSGDGRVTLAEAYRYAFERTVRDTSDTLIATQHPAYDYRLSGRGELVLTELTRPSAVLEVPGDFQRALVVALPREQVLAELVPGSARRIALPPGAYAVRLASEKGERTVAQVSLEAGQTHVLPRDAFRATPVRVEATPKGTPLSAPSRWSAVVAAGAQARVGSGLGGVLGLRAAVRSGEPSGVSGAVTLSTGSQDTLHETSAFGWFGLHHTWHSEPATLSVGLELGLGAILQTRQGEAGTAWSGAGGVAPWVGFQVPLAGPVSLAFEAQLPVTAFRRDQDLTVTLLPAAWGGLAFAL